MFDPVNKFSNDHPEVQEENTQSDVRRLGRSEVDLDPPCPLDMSSNFRAFFAISRASNVFCPYQPWEGEASTVSVCSWAPGFFVSPSENHRNWVDVRDQDFTEKNRKPSKKNITHLTAQP
jgi:hypothetical protein